jgi:hypothetical protein
MSDGRLPLAFGAAALGTLAPARTALVTTGGGAREGFALLRHAEAAAAAQAGACTCCRTPSSLVTVLRRLVLERARGEVDFAAVLVEGDPAALPRLEEEARRDPFIAARYEIRPVSA